MSIIMIYNNSNNYHCFGGKSLEFLHVLMVTNAVAVRVPWLWDGSFKGKAKSDPSREFSEVFEGDNFLRKWEKVSLRGLENLHELK